jgi:hypothetical protein
VSQHILDGVDILGQLLADRLLAPIVGRLRRRRADRQMSRGRVDCALKVISGRQSGLSRRWRHVGATVSAGHLDISGHWWRPFSGTQTIVVQAIGGPARPPSGRELWSLSGGCRIVEVQTPTGTLGWATLGHRLPAMLVLLERGRASVPDGPDVGFERSHAYDVTDTGPSRMTEDCGSWTSTT